MALFDGPAKKFGAKFKTALTENAQEHYASAAKLDNVTGKEWDRMQHLIVGASAENLANVLGRVLADDDKSDPKAPIDVG